MKAHNLVINIKEKFLLVTNVHSICPCRHANLQPKRAAFSKNWLLPFGGVPSGHLDGGNEPAPFVTSDA